LHIFVNTKIEQQKMNIKKHHKMLCSKADVAREGNTGYVA
jgi:hypothetical protein